VFFVSQLGKYLPGSVWPVLAQMEFGRRMGIARRIMFVANMLMLAVVAATGLVAGAVLLPWSSPDGLQRYWWTLLLLVPLAVGLHPKAVPAVLRCAFRLARRPDPGLLIEARGVRAALVWGVLTWLFLGVHLLVMTRALGASGSTAIAAAVGGMGLAFAAGLIFIPAPAGAGVRDAILVATLSDQIGAADALAVAVASRAILLAVDAVLAGAGIVVRRSTEPKD
jgi:hypothetical protein